MKPSAIIYYDARLIELSGETGLFIEYQGHHVDLVTFEGAWLREQIGKVGIAEYEPHSARWRFDAYLDQSLRRAYQLDHADRIGWTNDADPEGWTAPRGIVPGEHGAFIDDHTKPITIDVPQEFFSLCHEYRLEPEAVLRGFIADACGISSYFVNPRADRYSSNGSDERSMAADYLERAYRGRY